MGKVKVLFRRFLSSSVTKKRIQNGNPSTSDLDLFSPQSLMPGALLIPEIAFEILLALDSETFLGCPLFSLFYFRPLMDKPFCRLVVILLNLVHIAVCGTINVNKTSNSAGFPSKLMRMVSFYFHVMFSPQISGKNIILLVVNFFSFQKCASIFSAEVRVRGEPFCAISLFNSYSLRPHRLSPPYHRFMTWIGAIISCAWLLTIVELVQKDTYRFSMAVSLIYNLTIILLSTHFIWPRSMRYFFVSPKKPDLFQHNSRRIAPLSSLALLTKKKRLHLLEFASVETRNNWMLKILELLSLKGSQSNVRLLLLQVQQNDE